MLHPVSRRVVLPLLLAVSGAAGCAGGTEAGAAPAADASTLPAPSVTTLGRVRSTGGRLMDEWGRQWLLRGTNAKYERLFDVTFDDGRTRNEMLPEYDPALDPPETARLGFDFVRLAITWSGLEPEEGKFSEPFLQLLDRVVDGYEKAGVYVLIDFHEDGWSKEVGEDGAPYWAIVPPPPAKLGGPLWAEGGLQCPCDDLDKRRASTPVLTAFTSFFDNKENIQDRFLPAWKLLGARYRDRAGVIGFEAMNEPVAVQMPDGHASLDAFHVKAAAALRSVDPGHAYWLEPEVMTRNFTCAAPLRAAPFPDDNVVYAPHLYPGLCKQLPASVSYADWVANLTPTFDSMLTEAASYGGAVVLGEWWTGLGSAADFDVMDAFHALADARNIGLARWYWRGHSGNPACNGSGTSYCFRTLDQKWALTQPGSDHLSRPYPLAVPGKLVSHAFDRAASLAFTFEAAGGEAPPLVYLPAQRYPQGFVVEVDGKVVEVTPEVATQRASLPWDGRAGTHSVTVTPAQ